MRLKGYIKGFLMQQNSRFQEIIDDNNKALALLENINLRKAHYFVNFSFYGKETITHEVMHGSLEEAIHEAKMKFKKKYNHSDADDSSVFNSSHVIDYSVYINFDCGKRVEIPKEYWQRYIQQT